MLTLTSLVIGLFAFIVVRKFLYYREIKKFAREHGCQPTVQTTAWPLGLNTFVRTLRDLNKGHVFRGEHRKMEELGNTVEENILGRSVIFTREPENIKAILATQFQEFDFDNRLHGKMDLLLGNHGIFMQVGPAWEHTRAMLRPQFNRSQIVNDLDSLDLHVNRLTSKFPQNAKFDIQAYFFALTLDTATDFLFGESVESLLDKDIEHPADGTFAEAFNSAQLWIVVKLKAGPLYKFVANKECDHHCTISREFVGRYVERCLNMDLEKQKEERKGKYVFLDALAENFKDKTVLTDQIMNILLAGRDTTGEFLSFTMWFLSRDKRVWQKLRGEVLKQVGEDARPTWESIKDMKYLTYVLNESLRLLPVVPSNTRTAVHRTTLPRGSGVDGRSPIVVEKGQYINYSVFSLHRRKDVYGEDAEEFIPERWENLKLSAWDYLPFNGGPRICMGQQYALIEASFTLIRIMQRFQDAIAYDPETGEEVSGWGDDRTCRTFSEGAGLTMYSKNGVHVKLVPVGKK